MNTISPIVTDDNGTGCASSAVSWPAIIAGSLVAASISLVLAVFGSGIGLATVSPWHMKGLSAAGFTVEAAIWLIVIQWAASGLGGYLTGRLRTRWLNLHTDEVFFRDTAHGFLTWSLATVLVAGLLGSVTSAAVSGGTHAAATVAEKAGPADQGPGWNDPLAYYVDGLYRTTKPSTPTDRDVRMETTRIFATDLKNGNFPDEDKAYLSQVVAARAGISQTDASARVDNAITQATADKEKAKAAADQARKTAAKVSVFTALSMIIGAFIASVSAALGGKRRDQY